MNNVKLDNARMQGHATQEKEVQLRHNTQGNDSVNQEDRDDFENALNNDKNEQPKHNHSGSGSVSKEDKNNLENALNNKNSPQSMKHMELESKITYNQDYGKSNSEAQIKSGGDDNYQELPKDKHHVAQGKKTHGLLKKEEKTYPPQNQMDALLSGREQMLNQFNNKSDNNIKEVERKDIPDLSSEKLMKLAESILVSKADSNHQEVRITINNDILPQTDIIINRDKDGGLLVNLVTDNPSSWQTLVQGQHDLKHILSKTENNVIVQVQSSAENQAENNDSQRRSRSFMQATINDENT